jgi:5-methylcytosine-specific restriction protein A
MKLCNFLRFDPDYEGKGLDAGSKLDEEVWDEFYSDRIRLAATAEAIRGSFKLLSPPQPNTLDTAPIDEDEEFPEGRIIARIHKMRERNPKLVRQKKKAVLQRTGSLTCEVCGFDFEDYYGTIGEGFIECHHNVPLSATQNITKIKTSDLSIICPNCHRMIHKTRPWLQVQQLRQLLTDRGKLPMNEL